MTEYEILARIKTLYQNILSDKLAGIYVHGSIAFGCFAWERSDIDFLAVVKEKLTQEEKEMLIRSLLELDRFCPPKGLEMSVITESVCRPFVYPTPFELHFSNSHKEAFQKNLSAYCETMNGVDRDLAAHITVTKSVGIVLCGKPIDAVFDDVPRNCYLDSLLFDIENADLEINENPVYFILNLCRVLAYLEEGRILSKKQGGEWGSACLPAAYTTLITKALWAYASGAGFDGRERLCEFASYMLARIRSLSEKFN